jgi:hypothetical protein
MMKTLFWISLFVVFYTYVGYGILLCMLVKIKEFFSKPAIHQISPESSSLAILQENFKNMFTIHIIKMFNGESTKTLSMCNLHFYPLTAI